MIASEISMNNKHSHSPQGQRVERDIEASAHSYYIQKYVI